MTDIASVINRRDAADRVARIRFEREAIQLAQIAATSGDTELMTALAAAAAERGWNLSPAVSDRFSGESKKARTLLVDLLQLALTSRQRVATAQNFTDPRMTDQAQRDERQQLVATTMQEIQAGALSIRQQIAALTDQAVARAEQMRPRLDSDNAAQLARTAHAWQFNILPRLEGTPNWNAILESLDEDGLIAIARFAPNWISAHLSTFDAPAEIERVLGGAHARMIDIASDPYVRSALVNERDCILHITDADLLLAGFATLDRRGSDRPPLEITAKSVARRIDAINEIPQGYMMVARP